MSGGYRGRREAIKRVIKPMHQFPGGKGQWAMQVELECGHVVLAGISDSPKHRAGRVIKSGFCKECPPREKQNH